MEFFDILGNMYLKIIHFRILAKNSSKLIGQKEETESGLLVLRTRMMFEHFQSKGK